VAQKIQRTGGQKMEARHLSEHIHADELALGCQEWMDGCTTVLRQRGPNWRGLSRRGPSRTGLLEEGVTSEVEFDLRWWPTGGVVDLGSDCACFSSSWQASLGKLAMGVEYVERDGSAPGQAYM
jgi:hypothetical protein